MITPQQFRNPQVKPKWQLPVGVMESVVAYNCRKYGMPRPVLAMPMWEGAGNRVMDLSGHGNYGTNSGADWVADGLDFNGSSDYVEKASASNLPVGVTDDFSFSVLAYPRSLTNQIVYLFGDDWNSVVSGSKRGLLIHNTGNVYFYGHNVDYDTGVPYTLNDWNHIHLTYVDATGTLTVYKNGLNIGSTSGLNFVAGGTYIQIGGPTGIAWQNYLNGSVAHATIYNRTLTASQVKFLYDNPYFMYEIPEELYGYVSAVAAEANPYWYYQMLKRRN